MSDKPYIQPPFIPRGQYSRIFDDIYTRLNDGYADQRRIRSQVSQNSSSLNSGIISTVEKYIKDPSTIPAEYTFFEGIVSNEIWAGSAVIIEGWFDTITANTFFVDKMVSNNIFAKTAVLNQLFAQNINVTGSVKSNNYTPGVSGFHIDGVTGDAEFNNVVARGTFIGDVETENFVITDSKIKASSTLQIRNGDDTAFQDLRAKKITADALNFSGSPDNFMTISKDGWAYSEYKDALGNRQFHIGKDLGGHFRFGSDAGGYWKFTDAHVGFGSVTNPSEAVHSFAFIRADSGYKVGTATVIDLNLDAFFRNLELTGTINYVNEDNLQIEDKTITVNKNGTDTSALGAGIIVERPSGNKSFLWQDDYWITSSGLDVGSNASFSGTMSISGSVQVGSFLFANPTKNRFEVWDSLGEKIAMGYLDGLVKNNNPTETWSVNDYGFWVKDGDQALIIDGDVTYENGDWLIENDATFMIVDGVSGNRIIALGTHSGQKGLFFYDSSGVLTANITASSASLAGWNFDPQYLWVGTKQTTDGQYAVDGITLFSGGALRAKNFRIDLNGDAHFRGEVNATDGRIEGLLEIGAGGEITNTNKNFILSDTGLILDSSTQDISAQIRWVDSSTGLLTASISRTYSVADTNEGMLFHARKHFMWETQEFGTALEFNTAQSGSRKWFFYDEVTFQTQINTVSIIPRNDNSYWLGTSSNRWNRVYSTELHGASGTFTSTLTANGNNGVTVRRGLTGGYSNTSGSGTSWGANVWSIGDSWSGSGYGTNYSIGGGQYGLSWLRGDHTNRSASVGEGLYIYKGGSRVAAIGHLGSRFDQNIYLSTDCNVIFNNNGALIFENVGSGNSATPYLVARSSIGGPNNIVMRIGTSGVHFPFGVQFDGDINSFGQVHTNTTSLHFNGLFTTSSSANMWISSTTGQVRRSTSSRKYKEDIVDLSSRYDGLETINKLRPTHFKDKNMKTEHIGLIAEEVHEVIPELIDYKDGEPDGIRYGHITALLVEAVKNQQKQIKELTLQLQRWQ